jgi:hypothetical protein
VVSQPLPCRRESVLSERTDLQVFYQRQDSNNSTPGAIDALGLTLDVTFK